MMMSLDIMSCVDAEDLGNRSATPHVLVVEDSAVSAALVRFNLQTVGFRVTVARNGREAWHRAQRQSFDLVITDHQMPRMSGIELCQLLRQHDRYFHTPLILLTAKALEMDVDRVETDLGLFAVMVKPFSPAELVARVCQALERSSPAACAGTE